MDLSHGFYCPVRIEVLALVSLFSGECLAVTCAVVSISIVSVNTGCCGALWFLSFLVCSVFLIKFPEYILMSCV